MAVVPLTYTHNNGCGPNAGSSFNKVDSASGYRHVREFSDKPLAYTKRWDRVSATRSTGSAPCASFYEHFYLADPVTRNRLALKFSDAIHEAQLGNLVAQLGPTTSMVANRGLQLYRMATSLKRGDLHSFSNNWFNNPDLSRRYRAKARHRAKMHSARLKRDQTLLKSGAKKASDLWLEYSFGWSPLIDDITSATLFLSSKLEESKYIRASMTGEHVSRRGLGKFTPNYAVVNITRSTGVTMRDQSRTSALQLGVEQVPAGVWEAIPFSFIVDALIPIRAFYQLNTPTFRANSSNGWNSVKQTVSYTGTEYRPNTGEILQTRAGISGVFRRQTTSITPTPFITNPITGWRRAAHYVALSTQAILSL